MEVLVLEDDDALRMAFSDALEDCGYGVSSAGTVAEALALLRTTDFRLLVLDLLVGDEMSLPIAREAAHSLPDADVIVVTGSDQFPRGELHDSLVNVSWSLRKPVPLADLTALAQHAERRGRQM